MEVWHLGYGTNYLLLEDKELSPLHWWDMWVGWLMQDCFHCPGFQELTGGDRCVSKVAL